MPKTVGHVLEAKGTELFAIAPNATVYQALEMMAERRVGALIVMEGDRLAGIISERDYARKVILLERGSKDTLVREIMTDKVHTVGRDVTMAECMEMMTDKRIRHLPVVEGDRVVGVVSIGDIVKATIEEQRFMIEQLEQYITS